MTKVRLRFSADGAGNGDAGTGAGNPGADRTGAGDRVADGTTGNAGNPGADGTGDDATAGDAGDALEDDERGDDEGFVRGDELAELGIGVFVDEEVDEAVRACIDGVARLGEGADVDDRELLPPTAGREHYREDLVGFEAKNVDGALLGVVDHFVDTPGNAVMVINGAREHLGHPVRAGPSYSDLDALEDVG